MSNIKKEDWMNSKWRPMMGWMYMFVCFFDFVLAPILWSLTQAIFHGGVNVQWQPLTLQGAGLFHISMGAVLGIAAYGRTQEKLNGASTTGTSVGTTYTPPAPIQATTPTSFSSPTPTPISTPTPVVAPTITPAAVPTPTSSKSVVPMSGGFPPL